MRRWLAVGLLLLVGCSDDNGPDDDPFPGRWLLETVNGDPLPATGTRIGFPDEVVSGRLEVRAAGEGFPRWEFCTADADDGHLSLQGHDEVRYHAGDDTEAELSFVFPLFVSRDTLRFQDDELTWEYNLRSDPGGDTDLLEFRRLADGEAEGPVCALVESRR